MRFFSYADADSSDDDLPIAQIAKKHKKSASAVESDSDEDILLTDLSKKVRARIPQISIPTVLGTHGFALHCLPDFGSCANEPLY